MWPFVCTMFQDGTRWIAAFIRPSPALAARMQSLDLLANNLANVNTAGYKAQKEFYRAFTASLNNQRDLTPSTRPSTITV